MASSLEAIQKILQETVAPGISDLRERLTRVEVEIKRLDDKIDNGLARLENKMDNGFARQDARMDHLEDKLTTALEIRERLAALEARMVGR
jgi:peptidoglycan hydrolase CwlO-like protein